MDTTSIYNTQFTTLKLNFPVNYCTANFKNMKKRYRYCVIETYFKIDNLLLVDIKIFIDNVKKCT